jgi:SAM-dependent methyltransferase
MTLLNDDLKSMYSGYYAPNSSLEHKRGLSADATLEHILSVAGSHRWKRMMDVGAGNGSVLAKLDKTAIAEELYAVEISESGVDQINELRLSKLKEAKVFDGYKIDYPDKFFDVLLCIHVVEHVEHERLFLRELARVAKEVIIEVPLDGGMRVERGIRETYKFGHLNFYTVPGFLFLLKTSGMNVEQHLVTTSSAAYERHLYGGFKGTIKSAIRRHALKLFPKVAPWLFSYLLTVRCNTGVE